MRHPWALALAVWSLPAAAQDNAEALFNKGVDLLEAGKFAEACPALAESQKLDPRPGTLFTLADCEGRWGKPAQAFLHYREYLRQVDKLPPAQKTKHAERQAKAAEAAQKFQKMVARVSFPGAKAGTEVLIDGQKLAPEAVSEGTAIEPGSHQIVIRNGGPEQPVSASLAAGESYDFPVGLPTVTSVSAPPASSAPAAAGASASASGRSPTLFYVAAGAGAMGLAVGLLGGGLALSQKSSVSKECSGLACSSAGLAAVDKGRTYATVGTVGVVIGLLGAGAAAGLWASGVSSPRQTAAWVAPAVGVGQAGVAMGGFW